MNYIFRENKEEVLLNKVNSLEKELNLLKSKFNELQTQIENKNQTQTKTPIFERKIKNVDYIDAEKRIYKGLI